LKQLSKYKFHPKVVVRTPRKPISYEIDDEILKKNFSETIEKEAIFLASPHLYDAAINWLNGKELEPKEKRKLLHSLAKYFIRTSTRPTPFGLFSGINTLPWGEVTQVSFSDQFERHTRLDMNYLCELAKKLSTIPIIKERLIYYVNSSIYPLKNELRYVEIYYENNRRVHQISAIQKQKYIAKVLKIVGKKGAKYTEIISQIADEIITVQDATDFLDELIEMQILNSELEPTVTGKEFVYQIISILESINGDANPLILNLLEILKAINLSIQNIDSNKINEVSEYFKIIELIKKNEVSFDVNALFQTDLITLPSSESTINSNFQAQIIELVEFLQKIDLSFRDSNLQKFKDSFSERYQEQEVPLSQALDIENGIGYLDKSQGDFTPLVDRIEFRSEGKNVYEFNKNQQKLFEKLIEATQNQELEIDLSTIKFAEIAEENWKPMPPSFNVLFRELENDKLLIEGLGGSSAATLLGRFAHVDPNVFEIVKDITADEELINNEVIFAEIVHLPENRTGNVIAHPSFRKYEIPFLARPAVDQKSQVLLSDLHLSLIDNELVLRSVSKNKVVVPRLSNAHNYSNDALPVYQFLCDVQCQNTYQFINFDWGNISNGFKFLPRVTYKNIVVSSATWLFSKNDFESVVSIENLKTFFGKHMVPNQFLLADGDNELFIDTENELLLDVFLGIIKNSNRIVLKEFLNYSKNIFHENTGDIYANQFVASIINKQKVYGNIDFKASANKNRNFGLGSEWLYYKIYCGAKAADNILINSISKTLKKAQKQKLIKSWFFIRYNDPYSHLRLRFQLANTCKVNELIQIFNENLAVFQNENIAWKLQADTYERELERYGFESIEFHEQFFCASSNAILRFLLESEGENDDLNRWLFGLKLTDVTLNICNYDLAKKVEALKMLKESFSDEFKLKKEQKLNIDAKFRENKAAIFEFLDSKVNHYDNILQAFVNESKLPIKKILENSNTPEDLERSILSQIHMHINRVISSKQRQYELIMYDFLYRYYLSKRARMGK
jgi:lantibiotic biosynthesis protein